MAERSIVSELVKIVVYVPEKYADKVRLAMGKAGCGKIGNYDFSATVTLNKGYFRPLKGAKPFLGRKGKIEEVNEITVAVICPRSKILEVISAVKAAHPYEEPAIEIIPTLNHLYLNSK